MLVYDAEKKYHDTFNYTEYYVENENKESELRGYELTSFINTEKLTELSIDYVCTIENGEIKKDETKPVASIANMAFKWDTNIEKVYIGKDVENLNGGSFYKLNALKQIIVDKDNKIYCDVDGVLYSKDMTEIIFCPANYAAYLSEKHGYDMAVEEENYEQHKSDVLTYVVPSTVKKIGRACFFDSAFVEIYLPEGLERIESLSFLMSRNLKEVYSYKDSKPETTDGSAVSGLKNVYRSLPEGLQYVGVDTLNYTAVDYLFIFRSAVQGMGKPVIPMISGIAEMIIRVVVVFMLIESIGFMSTAYAQIAAWVGALIMNFSAYVFYIRKVTVKSEHRKFALFNKKMKGQIYNG